MKQKRHTSASRDVRENQEHQRRLTLLKWEDEGQKKRLEGRSRLQAALKISTLYRAVKAKGFQRGEINVRIGKTLGKRASSDFRIERWSLPFNISEITDELVIKYRDKPEPQKKASVYMQITRVLADLAGDDPLGHQLEMLDLIAPDTGQNEELPDIDPTKKLADLLQAYAHHLAHKLDLAALLEKAGRLQVGWDMHQGPNAKFLVGSSARLEPDRSARAQSWLDDSVPPFPSVRIATMPFQVWDGPFVVGRSDPGHEGFQQVIGSCICSWDLYLSIAPSGGGVGAFLSRSAHMDLRLDPTEGFPGYVGCFKGSIDAEEIEGIGVTILYFEGIELQTADGCQFTVSIEFLDEANEGLELEQVIAATGITTPLFRRLMVDPLLSGKFQPINTGTVRQWLVAPNSIVLDDYAIEPEACLPVGEKHHSDKVPDIWNVGPGLAHSLELALHGPELEAAFVDWVHSYRESLKTLEIGWINRTQDAEEALRSRWLSESQRP